MKRWKTEKTQDRMEQAVLQWNIFRKITGLAKLLEKEPWFLDNTWKQMLFFKTDTVFFFFPSSSASSRQCEERKVSRMKSTAPDDDMADLLPK